MPFQDNKLSRKQLKTLWIPPGSWQRIRNLPVESEETYLRSISYRLTIGLNLTTVYCTPWQGTTSLGIVNDVRYRGVGSGWFFHLQCKAQFETQAQPVFFNLAIHGIVENLLGVPRFGSLPTICCPKLGITEGAFDFSRRMVNEIRLGKQYR